MYKQILKIKLILQQFVHPFLLSYLGNACHFESHTTSVCSRFTYLSQVFAPYLNSDVQKNKLVKENLQHKKTCIRKNTNLYSISNFYFICNLCKQ